MPQSCHAARKVRISSRALENISSTAVLAPENILRGQLSSDGVPEGGDVPEGAALDDYKAQGSRSVSETGKLRLKIPSGAEIEVEGPPGLIEAEREAFLAAFGASPEIRGIGSGSGRNSPQSWPTGKPDLSIAWESVIESKGPHIQLRAKLRGDKTHRDACLVLLAAAHKLLNQSKPTAAQVAKWLRSSGYPIDRVDRAIAEAVLKGDILASGSRRARRYELTGPGKIKAYHLADQLASAFN